MKLLELFSGQGTISQTFKDNGLEAYRVDWSKEVEAELHADVMTLTVEEITQLCGGLPDVIWASPQCTTYSIATHRHRTLKEGLSPKTDMAAYDDQVNQAMWKLIDDLIAAGSKYYFVENPRGRMRHMDFVKDRSLYTVTYCSYGRKGNAKGYEDYYINKPTDIWTNHPQTNFKPQCNKSYEGHKHKNASEANKRDYLSRGEIPIELRQHLVNICVS
jgi:site-specific DNA-cytosine methylase